ncbi:MAG TPA: STAS domain-containing protein [Micromonosporaceae bacterium]
MHLSVVTQRSGSGVVEIVPQGEIDLSNAHEIRDSVTSILAGPRPEQIRCDLRRVTMIDSVGIGVLVGCYHAAAACQVPFILINPNRTVYRALWVSGLIGLFGAPEPLPETGTRSEPVKSHKE